MASAGIIGRLQAVAERLEAYVNSLPSDNKTRVQPSGITSSSVSSSSTPTVSPGSEMKQLGIGCDQLGLFAFSGTNGAYYVTPSSTIQLAAPPFQGDAMKVYSSVSYGDAIYVIGSDSRSACMHRYHYPTKEWSACASPSASSSRPIHIRIAGVLSSPARIICVGRTDSSDKIEKAWCGIYAIESQKWMPFQLSMVGYDACSVVYQNQFYLFGSDRMSMSPHTEIFRDFNGVGRWRVASSPLTRRSHGVAIVIGSSIYLMGGYKLGVMDDEKDTRTNVEEYKPSKNSWQTCNWNLPTTIADANTSTFGVAYSSITEQLMILHRSGTYILSAPFDKNEWIHPAHTIVTSDDWSYCSLSTTHLEYHYE
jgi:hypothetical protein